MRIRPGAGADVGVLLEMFDGAVAWLAANGREGQWGSRPWSEQPGRVQRIRQLAAEAQLWFAEVDGDPAGAIGLAEHGASYVPPARERELYVHLLITARAHAGHGVGTRLLDLAREQAAERGVGLLRVDCWAGGDGALVRYYTRAGFTPTARFDLNGWPGQLLEQRLPTGDH